MEFPHKLTHFMTGTFSCFDSKSLSIVSSTNKTDGDALRNVIDKMGAASAKAQKLPAIITSYSRMLHSDNHLYIFGDPQRRVVYGIIKTGRKKLFIRDELGGLSEIEPLCVLDFYVHESTQRKGYGKELFETMLEAEDVEPRKLGYDRPSSKLLKFLAKHYSLRHYVQQDNNFVVYKKYFERGAPDRRPSRISIGSGKLPVADGGLECQASQGAAGRSSMTRQPPPQVAHGIRNVMGVTAECEVQPPPGYSVGGSSTRQSTPQKKDVTEMLPAGKPVLGYADDRRPAVQQPEPRLAQTQLDAPSHRTRSHTQVQCERPPDIWLDAQAQKSRTEPTMANLDIGSHPKNGGRAGRGGEGPPEQIQNIDPRNPAPRHAASLARPARNSNEPLKTSDNNSRKVNFGASSKGSQPPPQSQFPRATHGGKELTRHLQQPTNRVLSHYESELQRLQRSQLEAQKRTDEIVDRGRLMEAHKNELQGPQRATHAHPAAQGMQPSDPTHFSKTEFTRRFYETQYNPSEATPDYRRTAGRQTRQKAPWAMT